MAARTLILAASPHAGGRTDALATAIEGSLAQDAAEAPRLLQLREMSIAPCVGCNRCKDLGTCFMRDDMDALLDALAQADELFVASPLYFAGPPAPLKAALDRLQPHFWLNTRAKEPKRAAWLACTGDGGDPHGHTPLETIVRSALAVAGFRLQATVACTGADASPECAAEELLHLRHEILADATKAGPQ